LKASISGRKVDVELGKLAQNKQFSAPKKQNIEREKKENL
jgi:hypothetical protein